MKDELEYAHNPWIPFRGKRNLFLLDLECVERQRLIDQAGLESGFCVCLWPPLLHIPTTAPFAVAMGFSREV